MDKFSNNEDETGSKSISTDEIVDKILPYKQERTETDEISDNENKFYTIISLDEASGHSSQIQMNCQSGENIATVCTVCGIECSSNENLVGHMRTHSGIKLYKYNVHGRSYNPFFKCDVCDKVFSKNWILKRHMRTHSGIKLYKYNVCARSYKCVNDETGSKSISTDEILDEVLPYKQERTETDEISDNQNKSYTIISLDEATGHSQIQMNCQSVENIDTVCTACGIECSSNENLVAHMRTHSGIKLYKYNVCAKSYKCDVCDKVFSQNQTLKIHMRIHTGD
ncbi:zinc finger protein 808-like [Mytilus californianus]|uniref:zinc finger protein 808-like n=1 Tax=Mytilus californianus TaxID=6549 RepID=UPI0022466D80|nr:zinc finger protein 808-like [Mytilus californianus]